MFNKVQEIISAMIHQNLSLGLVHVVGNFLNLLSQSVYNLPVFTLLNLNII